MTVEKKANAPKKGQTISRVPNGWIVALDGITLSVFEDPYVGGRGTLESFGKAAGFALGSTMPESAELLAGSTFSLVGAGRE